MMDGLHRDRLFAFCGAFATVALLVPLMLVLVSLLDAGLDTLSWEFLTSLPRESGRTGGIFSVLVASVWILGTCLAAAVPIGLGCALFLSEFVDAGSKTAMRLGFVLDGLAAVPSIVYALFGYQLFAVTLGFGFSILSGGLTLACMVLPLMIRSSEQALRAVPTGYRQAALALSVSRSGLIVNILLPLAAPGIAAGIILSTGRALAETAALLFTAGYVLRMPGSIMDSGRALSVHIYDLAVNVPGGTQAAAASALVLFALLALINSSVRIMTLHWQRHAL